MSGTRSGPGRLGPFVEGYRAWLLEAGYTPQTVRLMLKDLGRLGRWMDAEGIEIGAYCDSEQTLELVTVRVTAQTEGADVTLAHGEEDVTEGSRTATLGGEQVELAVLRGSPAAGRSISGPAVVELPESTLLVPPLWSGQVDEGGTIKLERDD